MAVTVALLDISFAANVALKGPVMNMAHYVVSHIADSECSLVALLTDQNLVFAACVRVDFCLYIVL